MDIQTHTRSGSYVTEIRTISTGWFAYAMKWRTTADQQTTMQTVQVVLVGQNH